MNAEYLEGDIPESFLDAARTNGCVSIDIETTGLEFDENEVCLIQMWLPERVVIVRPTSNEVPLLGALLSDPKTRKIFHHAMFDLRFLVFHFKFSVANIACTKIMSKLLSPNNLKHSLKTLLKDHLGIEISKTLQVSDWSKTNLSKEQLKYAIDDVAHLRSLHDKLLKELEERRLDGLLRACFTHVPARVKLDLLKYDDVYSY